MSKTIPLIFNIFKDCGTCEHLCFLETTIDKPEVAKCSLTNEIVTDEKHNSTTGIVYKDIECDKWIFDKRLLEDTGYFIDLETSPTEIKE